mmetsp:Transcript_43723/g.108207  ORF Transcript_43723/g.108207 Transcript_43723/m.108207 type:complete len:521 (-) Transcript_43723:153-1715(-)
MRLRCSTLWGALALGIGALHPGGASETPIELGALVSGYVAEDDFMHYSATIPPSSQAVKVIITPMFGDPDVYLSFFTEEPDDTTATWMLDEMGTEERLLRRQASDFCTSEPCVLHISVYGYEKAEFRLAVYNTTDLTSADASPKCAANCNEFDLSDGVCDIECNSTACFYDGGDCLVTHSRGTCDWKTRAGCPSSWIGDGVCDEECFVAECEWDGNDCAQKNSEEICNPGCMSTWINDGECDSECNVEECNFDGSDCAHAVSECFHKPNGEDYRGRIATTSSGLLCQKWSAQFPHQHTTTHVNFPRSGLGGHAYCRNPGGQEAQPYCFTTNPSIRWEFCSVPKPFEQCMANEVPTAAKSDSATPCVIDGPTPSGPLIQFRSECGVTGENSTYGDICSRACCNAAEEAALHCPTEVRWRQNYTTYALDVQWTMLQHKCTNCRVYSQFFQNAHMLKSLGGPQVVSIMTSTGYKVVLVAGLIVMSLLLCVICVLVRYVYARKNYSVQMGDVEADESEEEDEDE